MTVVAEIFRPWPELDFVGRPAEIADDQLVVVEPAVQRRLKVAEILHPLGQSVADEDHMVPLL